MSKSEQETYFYNPATGERLRAKYLVTLVVPCNYFGQVEVEAQSEEEAARLARDKSHELDWECSRLSLHGSKIEVLDIECGEPPKGAVLFRPSAIDDATRGDSGAPFSPAEKGDRQ